MSTTLRTVALTAATAALLLGPTSVSGEPDPDLPVAKVLIQPFTGSSSRAGCTGPAVALAVAARLGKSSAFAVVHRLPADIIVTGSVADVGEVTELAAEISDRQTGLVVRQDSRGDKTVPVERMAARLGGKVAHTVDGLTDGTGSALFVSASGSLHWVRKVSDGAPYALEDGKWQERLPGPYVLRRGADFLPTLVTFRGLYVARGDMAISEHPSFAGCFSGDRLVFATDLLTDHDLRNVVLVFAFEKARGGRSLWAAGLPDLAAGKYQHVSIDLRTVLEGETRGLRVHLYADGREVLTTALPRRKLLSAFDRIAILRASQLKDAPAEPLFQLPAAYPTHEGRKDSGKVLVTFRIDSLGRVSAPAVAAASAPAFGTAALTAIKQWRFAPRMQDGLPRGASGSQLFVFDPSVPYAAAGPVEIED